MDQRRGRRDQPGNVMAQQFVIAHQRVADTPVTGNVFVGFHIVSFLFYFR